MTAEVAVMKGLSAEDITDLLGKSRARNQYGPRLVEFCESDEAAINPREVWPEMKDKNGSTMYQGFVKAMRDAKLDETLSIRQTGGEVYILHNERVKAVLAAAADTDSE